MDTTNLALTSGTSLTNGAGDNFTMTAAAGKIIKFSGTIDDTFTNAGSLIANGAGTADVSVAVINSANIFMGSGTLAFLYNVTNNGTVDAAAGVLSSKSAIGGTGTLEIDPAGTLSLLDGATIGQTVDFLAATGSLDLTLPLDFKGTIERFGRSDQIDLVNTVSTSDSYANGVLTVDNDTTMVAALNFAGSYTQSNFMLASDGHGGTLITLT